MIAFSQPFFKEEEAQAVADVVRSLWVTGGPRLEEFERRFAEQCNAPYAVGVSSWTTGAFLVLSSYGIKPGDEVIVPSLTFIASVNVIRHVGATPVFADIDPHTWNIDPQDVKRKITPKTKAILPVDQIGLPCDMDALNEIAAENNLIIIQDAACSFASRNQERPMGSLCETSIFSLHARKIITTGEGGMIVTKNKDIADKLRILRHQGMSLSDYVRRNSSPTTFETYPEIGYNFRITDIQAALGLAQLNRLEEILECRREIAARYNLYFKNHPYFRAPFVPEGIEPNWQSYQIELKPNRVFSRNELIEELFTQKISTRRGVMASHHEAPYQHINTKLPHTDFAAANTLLLPMHPAITNNQQKYIFDQLSRVSEKIEKS